MKRLVSILCVALLTTACIAQNSYIVKTKGVKKSSAIKESVIEDSEVEEAEEEETDFVGKYFKYRSLCDWEEGMRFMVLPEKYDLIVNTFTEESTGREVSSGKLRYKIMVYKGHTETEEGENLINFTCEDNGANYYFQIPNGSFEDYCYKKSGIATLAYLGDVDKAREVLMGKKLLTKTTEFRVDTEYDGDGYQEITVPKSQIVTVVAIGVGSRSFPVKIIVEDEEGKQYFQNVALSKINSGMRDDEFIMDKAKYTFYDSFELIEDESDKEQEDE